ncbi:MAG: ATP-binding protein [Gammaproteobacteria bacterium]|nr:MAG: ATP-binding protein [Gammaproteobacteria bacterium]
MKKQFKKIIVDFIERDMNDILPREYQIPLESNKVICLIGVRRAGKTSILFDVVDKLRKKVVRENIIYVNFEDDRLYPLGLKDLDSLLESYYELYPAKRDEKIYLFLDEVQVVDNWELYVRRIYDTSDIQIYITGSSAKLLSTEIATSLRGRTLTYEIYPFSFKEYLSYKNIAINFNSSKQLSYIKNALSDYLINGGFAETINQDQMISQKILSDYLELIIYKDIVDRHNVKNRSLLKILTKYCFNNIATLISFNKLFNNFKSQGYKLSKDTIYEYVSHLEDAFALFVVPIYRNSIKQQQRNPKKMYAIDNGFKKIYDYAFDDDMGKLYENVVFLHLRRMSSQIYYYKQKQEVDFYVRLNNKKILINVSYDITNPDTKKREIAGLMEAMDYFKLNQSYLINNDHDEILKINNKRVIIKPLFEFLLDSEIF